jgi:hypothetical protein
VQGATALAVRFALFARDPSLGGAFFGGSLRLVDMGRGGTRKRWSIRQSTILTVAATIDNFSPHGSPTFSTWDFSLVTFSLSLPASVIQRIQSAAG